MKSDMFITGIISACLVGYLLFESGIKEIVPFAALFTSLFLLLVSCLLPGCDDLSGKLAARFENKPGLYWFFPLYPLTLYLLTQVTQNRFFGLHLLYFSIYIFIPVAFVFMFRKTNKNIQYISGILTATALWIPFDHRWYKWFWPGRFLFGYDFSSLMAVMMIVFLFLIVGKQKDVGYNLIPRKKDFLLILILIVIFAAVIIPPGLITGFLEFRAEINFEFFHLLAFIGIFLTIALVEEVVFRGIIQNFLEKLFKRHWPALILASVLFGMTHWNNAAPGYALHYITLASVAGVLYGTAYKRGGSLFPAIFLHALVDTIWLMLFAK